MARTISTGVLVIVGALVAVACFGTEERESVQIHALCTGPDYTCPPVANRTPKKCIEDECYMDCDICLLKACNVSEAKERECTKLGNKALNGALADLVLVAGGLPVKGFQAIMAVLGATKAAFEDYDNFSAAKKCTDDLAKLRPYQAKNCRSFATKCADKCTATNGQQGTAYQGMPTVSEPRCWSDYNTTANYTSYEGYIGGIDKQVACVTR
ncbi:MAG: hypothetical protein SFV15_23510 [Polyangiaceae bacterium]|nr:hypothetical protein [Polyangiaceae bacterium]